MDSIGAALLYVLAVVAFAWLARRLLGAHRVSWWRAIIAGIVGCIVGVAIGVGLDRWGVDDDVSAQGVALVSALLVSMGLIVALQLVSRPRSGPTAGLSGAIGGLRASRRSAEVVRIAASHGLGGYLGRRGGTAEPTGAQIRAALEDAGVVFVKFGQTLAGRPDLVSPAIATELERLRHQVTPLDRDVMEAALRQALPDAESIFATIDWEPLGSASIAQAYLARLADGREVVVKVRRPGIAEEVERDGHAVRHLARVLERHSARARTVGIADLADSFVRDLEHELDYRIEARSAREMATALDGTGVGVPQVHETLSSETVLVMDRAAGAPLADADLSHLPADQRHAMATALVSANVGAMLAGDRFHADPHPGNVMVDVRGRLTLIDFGATGVLGTPEQASLSSLLLGMRLREPALLRDALLGVADADRRIEPSRIDRALAHLLAEHITPGDNISPEAVVELLRIMSDEGLRLPATASAMFRSLITVLDSLERLEPGFAVLDAIDEVADVSSSVPESPADLVQLSQEEALKLLPLLRRAPRLVDSVVTRIDRGDLTVHVRLLSYPEDARIVTRLVNRVVLALTAGILGIVSAMLFGVDKGPDLTPNFSIYDLLAAIGLLAGAVLVMRVVLEALDDDP